MNAAVREQFPALERKSGDHPLIYLDGPAGTQVPSRVIDAFTSYYSISNANTHGHFETSRETDDIIEWSREQCAALLNAENTRCISFGANMTSLAFKLSRAFSRIFAPGDEVVITQLDHEANRGPWLALERHGIAVREIALLPDGTLDYDQAAEVITERTRLVCAGLASNIFGTVNDIARLRSMSTEAGAWLLIDAVHYAPHFVIDVQELDCDFLLCSAYKFYGPHIGILYSKPGLLDTLETDRLRTAGQSAPERIETGTLNHASLAGVGASIDFIASCGEGTTKRQQLTNAFETIGKHERKVGKRLWDGLATLKGVTRYGPEFDDGQRSPTVAFTIENATPAQLCKSLGQHGICAWDGHFYAIRATEVLNLLEKGGVTRMGVVVYNTEQEVDRTLNAVSEFINQLS